MNLALWLERAGKAFPENPAVALGEQVVQTYGELSQRAAKMADGLKALGLVPGDRVAICSNNRPEYVEAMYGMWWGALHPRELGCEGLSGRTGVGRRGW